MKRSTGVVLVLMGATAVGGTAGWVSSRNCSNVQPGTPQAEQCRTGSSSRAFWGGYGSSQSSYNKYPANKAAPAPSPGVARSGFGSTSHGYSGS